MRNLLRSNLFRLRKDVVFWLALAVCLGAGIAFAVSYLDTPGFDDVYFFPLFLALAAVLSLFLGREYSDGTLRNAVTAGHRRRGMYGAGLVTALLVSLLCLVAFWLPFLLVQGEALVRLGAGVVVPVAVGFLLLMAAMTALFTAVSFNVPNLAAGAIVNLVLWVGLMLGAYQLEFALGQPEYIREVTMSAQGEMVEGPKMQNPNYLDGPLRVVYEGMEACLPHSQLNDYVSYLSNCLYVQAVPEAEGWEETDFLYQAPVCSLAVTVCISGLGLALFQRKDLK